MSELIKKFFVEEVQGKCTDDEFEFGNLHRKNFKCSFCANGNCHYKGECDSRDDPNQHLGWRIS